MCLIKTYSQFHRIKIREEEEIDSLVLSPQHENVLRYRHIEGKESGWISVQILSWPESLGGSGHNLDILHVSPLEALYIPKSILFWCIIDYELSIRHSSS